jgi:hypothetical protein
MRKYTQYFKAMMMFSSASLMVALAAAYEKEATICALATLMGFSLGFAAIMASDSEKFTLEYLKKYKGWS